MAKPKNGKKPTKVTNAVLARFYSLNRAAKDIAEELDGLKDIFKMVGSLETAEYKLSVSPGSSRQMGSIEEVAKAFKVTEKQLDKMGLIRKSEYERVVVTKKKED